MPDTVANMTKEDLGKFIRETVKDSVAAETQAKNEDAGAKQRIDNPTEFMKELAAMIAGFNAKQKLPADDRTGVKSARIVRALCGGKGDPERAVKFVKQMQTEKYANGGAYKWDPEDEATIKALELGSNGTGYIMPTEYSQEMIELLRATTAVRKLGPRVLRMQGTNNVQIPKLATGTSASYINSSDEVPVTGVTFGNLHLTFKKLAALVPVSNDLIRYSSPDADMIVRDDLVASIKNREDQAFISDDGTDNTPRGMLHWCPAANKFNANATVNLANVTTDLGKLMYLLMDANVGMISPGWLMHPRSFIYLMTVLTANGVYAFRDEMMRGTLWGYKFAVTTNIPRNLGGGSNESKVYFADFADLAIGESMDLELAVSDTAAYSSSGTVVAAFSKDQTVIRVIAEHDFGARHAESIAVAEAVTWGV